MSAARYHGVPPDELAYLVHEKRHGFVRHPRSVVIAVDPAAPRRAPGAAPPAPAVAPAAPPAAPTAPAAAPAAPAAPRAGGGRERARPERHAESQPAPARRRPERPARPARPAAEAGERWDAPDEESLLAAGEAARRLVRFAALELAPEVASGGDRVEVALVGPDEGRLLAAGPEALEDLEHLLPRAVHGLCGRMVRARVDCGGRRAARERELRALARRAAAAVLEAGEEQLLEPLPPADRRIVHLELAALDGVASESLGDGVRKRVRIFRAG
jgi:hypothetical protein